MRPVLRRRLRIAALAILTAAALVGGWQLIPETRGGVVNATFWRGLAIEGHDPVAYFREGRPVPGAPEFQHHWMGATWRFASAANRDAFIADPERWAPQFGGYCAYAVAYGHTAPIDPDAWTIRDGRLYLNATKRVQAKWEAKLPDIIARGEAQWPAIEATLGR